MFCMPQPTPKCSLQSITQNYELPGAEAQRGELLKPSRCMSGLLAGYLANKQSSRNHVVQAHLGVNLWITLGFFNELF